MAQNLGPPSYYITVLVPHAVRGRIIEMSTTRGISRAAVVRKLISAGLTSDLLISRKTLRPTGGSYCGAHVTAELRDAIDAVKITEHLSRSKAMLLLLYRGLAVIDAGTAKAQHAPNRVK